MMRSLAAAVFVSALAAVAPAPSPAVSGVPVLAEHPDAATLRAHPDSKAEWWYYTGHLETASRREYGFELTFFRARLSDGDDLDAAHFALTDVAKATFDWAEKLHRPFPGIAGADAERLHVYQESWDVHAEGRSHVLRARMPDAAIALLLTPVKPLVRNGAGGVSRKGPRPDEYSNYVSIPRMSVLSAMTTPTGHSRRRVARGIPTGWPSAGTGRRPQPNRTHGAAPLPPVLHRRRYTLHGWCTSPVLTHRPDW